MRHMPEVLTPTPSMCFDGGMTNTPTPNTQYTSLATLAPWDVVRFDNDRPWMRVLSVHAYDVPWQGRMIDRVSVECASLAYEGYPGGHWVTMADPTALVERLCDSIPTVLHPCHTMEVVS